MTLAEVSIRMRTREIVQSACHVRVNATRWSRIIFACLQYLLQVLLNVFAALTPVDKTIVLTKSFYM